MRKFLVTSFILKLPMLVMPPVMALVMANAALASSIITIAVPDQTPSIVSAGKVAAAPVEMTPDAVSADDTKILAIGNSVIAVGPDAIPPSHEEVSSITEKVEWLTGDAPLPLRIGN